MKKNELPTTDDDMLPEYDFRGGVRGKYARDYGRNRNLRILDPDLLAIFPDSESVNEALRELLRMRVRFRIDDSAPHEPRDREHDHGQHRSQK
jgi:hypothetical protein